VSRSIKIIGPPQSGQAHAGVGSDGTDRCSAGVGATADKSCLQSGTSAARRRLARMERIIEYLFWEEIRHWEELGKPRNHIFTDVRRVDRWLDKVSEGKRAFKNAR
jgi:hypothetical protein